ncbi:non-canonical purine NTP diphosphatase [Capnocytophaga canimorsus]|uniref:dITP/XTP pyrophosphatase n=1 Tax=Capnocytophaga canimorsus (strain 5) TaxID=860228 RepID=F9YPD6_CAPCC|nr:non-canonical purine NTP diphosphatase [Capnocytophaga canimorsus]AEK23330.1 Nucleoside triphosphate phosphohydrolase [Capnocytophaga canimorsus Cc5]WGU67884.1 non-canonical purine NTP diphosphatase [Capnocytophaga canimorsus]WGU71006.1 non-canonical purine NTP diphosphatase [Capnocytophaga canimorsus]VEJ18427.1 Non-canonical purine NTP pyrophosphatase [Capnocytophaga canimorsus]
MKLVFATHNPNKLREIQALMPQGIQLLSLTDIGCDTEIEENASTIEGNAVLKAKYVYEKYGFNVFADDTGLEVMALDNKPGVFSARYAGENKNDTDNIALLLKNLEGNPYREARFRTVIALYLSGELHTFEGIVEGTITEKPIGNEGFGYDPIFKAHTMDKTFAQISAEEKNRISHRGKAFQKLLEFLSK